MYKKHPLKTKGVMEDALQTDLNKVKKLKKLHK